MNIDEKIARMAEYVIKWDVEQITNSSYDGLIENLLKQDDAFKEKVLSQEKFIEHEQLNKQGLHLLRCLSAEMLIEENRLEFINHPLYNTFATDGILVLENKFHWYEKQDQELWDLLSMCAGQKVKSQPFRDNVFGHFANDIQYQLHTDIFQPNVKSWMYLQDITLAHGPTGFILGSHINDERKLKWLYHMSTLPVGHPDIREGSFPLLDHKKWGFDDPKFITGGKGTYIIVDTCGFHCRGLATPGTVRKTAKLHYRFNPFDLV